MKALVSTRKDTSTTGTVIVKINGAISTIPVNHYQILDYNGNSYMFAIGTSCCVHYTAYMSDASGNRVPCLGKILCSGPEVELDI